MKILLAIQIFFLLVFSSFSNVSAMWARMNMEELVSTSTLIVIGKLVSTGKSHEQQNIRAGSIQIQQVIVGDKTLQKVSIAIPPKKAIQSSTDIHFNKGQNGIWFLRMQESNNDGTGTTLYLADHPQRLQPAKNIEKLKQYLQSHPSTQ